MLSIILPTYKGAKILRNQLPAFVNFLDENKIEHEIIVVDDGSNDNGKTKEAAIELGCLYLENVKNTGKGAAVRKGMMIAKGDYYIFTDIDIPFHYEAFTRFLYSLIGKNPIAIGFDIVVGDRNLPESSYYTKISPIRKLGSDIFSFIVSRIFTAGLYDTQCGMKGFKKEVAKDLFSVGKINRFAFDVELISIAIKRKYTIKRLPVSLRSNESNTVKVIQHGLGMLFDLVRIIIYHWVGVYKKD